MASRGGLSQNGKSSQLNNTVSLSQKLAQPSRDMKGGSLWGDGWQISFVEDQILPGVTCHIFPPPFWCSTGTLSRCCQGNMQRLPVKRQAWLSQVYKKKTALFSPLACWKVQTEYLVELLIIWEESETGINKFDPLLPSFFPFSSFLSLSFPLLFPASFCLSSLSLLSFPFP